MPVAKWFLLLILLCMWRYVCIIAHSLNITHNAAAQGKERFWEQQQLPARFPFVRNQDALLLKAQYFKEEDSSDLTRMRRNDDANNNLSPTTDVVTAPYRTVRNNLMNTSRPSLPYHLLTTNGKVSGLMKSAVLGNYHVQKVKGLNLHRKSVARNKELSAHTRVKFRKNSIKESKFAKRVKRNSIQSPRPKQNECARPCTLKVHNVHDIRRQFLDALEYTHAQTVQFNIRFKDDNRSLLDIFPYMGNTFQASEWIWARGKLGRNILGLPLDSDVLSLYLLPLTQPTITLLAYSFPEECFVKQSPSCRIKTTQKMLIENVTHIGRIKQERNYICHRIVNATEKNATYKLLHKCCDTTEYMKTRNNHHSCHIYSQTPQEISGIIILIYVLAGLVTIFSPVFIMKLKLILSYDSTTKFFRASLKHGITGQRNYVIRISSRQLINLSENKPFSLPLFIFRLLFHCYGEGRCFIHYWGDWPAQPRVCRKASICKKIYMTFWRIFAVLVLYPSVFYLSLILYLARLHVYKAILELLRRYGNMGTLDLNVNIMALILIPYYNPWITIWIVFSFVCFLYSVFIVSWPKNTLERCLLGEDEKRTSQKPKMLYNSLTRSYKTVLHRMAYGDFNTKRYCFRITCLPWGLRRTVLFIGRILMQIPIINVAFSLLRFDSQLFTRKKHKENDGLYDDIDELSDPMTCPKPICPGCCKWIISLFIWVGFLVILLGHCSAVFIITQFALNVVFFTLIAIALNSHMLLPWVCFIGIIIFYINDTLTVINREHKEILRLIDANSPRISAVEDSESVFTDTGTQILKTHNLGAVKFIDGDSTEYVSKELYYGVCSDLKCGWSVCVRRVLYRCGMLTLYSLLVFMIFLSLSALVPSSRIVITLFAIAISLAPKIKNVISKDAEFKTKVAVWTKIIPEILDKHIRVNRNKCLDENEEALSTYDVRPVGHLELEIPKMVAYSNLRMWKFPWIVSADQQTQSPENFMTALSSKLAAAAFLSKVVTRLYSLELHNDQVLRSWCLLVENCIMEGSATVNNINGVPLESVRLFPREVQSLVTHFRTGSTIDNVVDNINRELYGPFTKGVLVTIGNTPLAIGKLDNLLIAFNANSHGEQVTDLFGAVLIMTDFNIQNLQTIVKFIMDPYSPDTVPVYTMVPMEGFVFQSPEILELESPST